MQTQISRCNSLNILHRLFPLSSIKGGQGFQPLCGILCCLAVIGCAEPQWPEIRVPKSRRAVTIPGFDICDATHEGPIALDPSRPLTVVVHGCNASGGRFRSLAQVFHAHGQQAICFNYDDRDSMDKTAARLRMGLNRLTQLIAQHQITVIGHSQGGLVARRAFTQQNELKSDDSAPKQIRLVTISSPFKGIQASAHCAIRGLHIATLGVSVGICAAIAGAKWNEIHPDADFIQHPGHLNDNVNPYFKIVTDERNTCRRYDREKGCVEDDYVFSVEEQYHDPIDNDPRVNNTLIKAGHAEIVGGPDAPPLKLLSILQEKKILRTIAPEQKLEVAQRIREIYKDRQR